MSQQVLSEVVAFPKMSIFAFLNSYRNMRLDGDHRTLQNLISLLSHINPHKPVSPATLARWLKELMQLAGDTTTFKAHSVRGAVATEAAKQGFSIPRILQFADWSQASTFTKFYYRPQFDTSPGRAILSLPYPPISVVFFSAFFQVSLRS